MEYHYEHFNSIYEFDRALKERKVNPAFVGNQSSKETGSYREGQTKTKDFAEADELLMKGWNAKVDGMSSELEKYSRTVNVQRRRQYASMVGFAPCVPKAIMGVPKSMLASKEVESKVKHRTVHLILNNCGLSNVTADELMDCGMTVLKLACLLDKSQIRTRIDVVPKMSMSSRGKSAAYGCTVKIKDYRQPLNLSKMAYPLAHVSMFRRHGFNWMEVQEGDIENWVGNYGQSVYMRGESEKKDYFKYCGFDKKDIVYIDLSDCRAANFDPKKLAEMKGIKVR